MKTHRLKFLFLLLILPAGMTQADTQQMNDKQKLSYAIGAQFANNILQQPFDLDTDSFVEAIRDSLNGKELKLSIDEIRQVLVAYQQQQIQQQEEIGNKNKQEGQKFLEENRKNKDVKVLQSGLQYKIIKQGAGPKPTLEDNVTVHYKGILLNGKEFDSSYERENGAPVSISLNQVIKGWQEAVTMMPVGSKWEIYVPAELAYGERANGPVITPFSTLIFDIELISIN
jgi:FKBP-type peptidyl-prolyl cis-trans isomerase FklB